MAAEEAKHYLANGQATAPDAREALEWARETTAQMVDLKFCDLLGSWQHMTLPIRAFDESAFDDGLGFDGSSIRGWQGISESDMLLMPDASSAILDPFTEAPTLSLICEIADPITREPYAKDPRRIAKKAEDYLRSTGIADTAYMGPECEFFVFDEVSYELGPNRAHYAVDSAEGHWNSGAPGLGYTVREKEGYFPPAPHDTLHDLRTQMVLTLERLGIRASSTITRLPPAASVDRPPLPAADADGRPGHDLQVRRQERRPCGGQVGDVHAEADLRRQRLGHAHAPDLVEGRHAAHVGQVRVRRLSQLARAYIGGLLAHAPALLAFCAPTTNSYRRLVPGYEAPVNLVYSMRNRSACIRIPMYSDSPKAKRIEFRCPDAAANPYLAFSAMVMAGIDGIQKGLDAGEPADWDLFEEDRGVAQVPGSLAEALDALEVDHEFLTAGGVFSDDVILDLDRLQA